jgi:hypothetical protein
MAAADAAWLHMDRPTNLMVVNCVFWFDRPLNWDAVADAFTERLVPAVSNQADRTLDPGPPAQRILEKPTVPCSPKWRLTL